MLNIPTAVSDESSANVVVASSTAASVTTEAASEASTKQIASSNPKDKIADWWAVNGGLAINDYTPTMWATHLSLVLADATKIYDDFKAVFHESLVDVPDTTLMSMRDGIYLREVKRAIIKQKFEAAMGSSSGLAIVDEPDKSAPPLPSSSSTWIPETTGEAITTSARVSGEGTTTSLGKGNGKGKGKGKSGPTTHQKGGGISKGKGKSGSSKGRGGGGRGRSGGRGAPGGARIFSYLALNDSGTTVEGRFLGDYNDNATLRDAVNQRAYGFAFTFSRTLMPNCYVLTPPMGASPMTPKFYMWWNEGVLQECVNTREVLQITDIDTSAYHELGITAPHGTITMTTSELNQHGEMHGKATFLDMDNYQARTGIATQLIEGRTFHSRFELSQIATEVDNLDTRTGHHHDQRVAEGQESLRHGPR